MSKIHVQTKLNGEDTEFLCEPRQSLLVVLRETLGFTGTKEGCSDGNCGACSVQIDGVLANSCLVFALEADGKEITTVEGLASPEGLHPIQQKFLEHAALQCGICWRSYSFCTQCIRYIISDFCAQISIMHVKDYTKAASVFHA